MIWLAAAGAILSFIGGWIHNQSTSPFVQALLLSSTFFVVPFLLIFLFILFNDSGIEAAVKAVLFSSWVGLIVSLLTSPKRSK